MARERLLALAVGLQHPLIGVRRVVLHPRQQRRPKVEADAGVVVDDLCDPARFVENPRGAIGQITLGGNALVPVMVWRDAILQFHRFQPGIFARRLVKVTMDTEITCHQASPEAALESDSRPLPSQHPIHKRDSGAHWR
jgi:hypothetical protein